jgi:hypothetical protein
VYPIAEFNRLVYAVAASQNWTVESVAEAGMPPNFHAAKLSSSGSHIYLVGHSNFPIVAFVERLEQTNHRLQFVDNVAIAGEISRLWPDVEIGTATVLNRPITDSDLAQLSPTDRNQVHYWKPQTIGQLAFNWWD